MAIDLKDLEDLNTKNESNEQEISGISEQEQCEIDRINTNAILVSKVDHLSGCIKDIIIDGSILDTIYTHDLKSLLAILRTETDRLSEEIDSTEEGTLDMEDLQVPIIDLGITCVMLFSRLNQDLRVRAELNKREEERLRELEDLAAAKPIFEMLKNEVKNWDDYFDEFTISKYISQMLEIAKKYGEDFGIDQELKNLGDDIGLPEDE